MTHGRPDEASGEYLDPNDPYRYGRPEAPPAGQGPPAAPPPGSVPGSVPGAGPGAAGGPDGLPPGYQHPPPVDGWVAYPPPPSDEERSRRYGPSPYASVPPPPGHVPGPPPFPGAPGSPAPTAPKTRTATTALVLGLASLPGAFFAYLDVVPVLLAVFFGLKVLNEGRPGRNNAIAGLVAAALGGLFAIVVSVQLTAAVGQCGGWSSAQDPSFQQCVQNHL